MKFIYEPRIALNNTQYMTFIKNTFTVPTDAHYYKIIEMLKQYKKL